MYKSSSKFYKFLGSAIILSFGLALIFYVAEVNINNNLNTPLDLIYWWVNTITTVGSSNIHPQTSIGKILATLITISGTLLYFGAFSEAVLFVKQKTDSSMRGLTAYNGNGHIIIAGYNMMALGLIYLLDKILKPGIDIVLITNQLDANPLPDRIHFIRSLPATAELLQKANVRNAKVAFILSDDRESTIKMDLNTILVAGMIEDLASDVFTIAELNDSKSNKEEINQLHIDETISFTLLLNSVKSQDSQRSQQDIINLLPKKLQEEVIKPDLV